MSGKVDNWQVVLQNTPPHWDRVPLGQVLSERSEQNWPNLPLLSVTAGEGVVPRDSLSRKDNSNPDKAKYLRICPGDIVYNTMRMWQGVSAVVRDEGIVSPAYTVCVPTNRLDVNYAGYLLKYPSLVRVFHSRSQGLVDDTLSLKFNEFAKIHIPLPPVAEQKKIIAVLKSADEAIQTTHAVIEQIHRFKQGLLQELLTHGIGHTRFKEVAGKRVPDAWRVTSLSSIAEIRTGIAKGKRILGASVRVPYLRVANVQDGYLDLSNIQEIEINPRDAKRYLLAPGDVLLTEGGDLDKLGRGDVWRGQIPSCVHQNHVFAVRCDHSQLNPDYLSLLTGSSYGKAYFLACAKRTTNLASINSTQLREFPVLLPSRREQDEIVRMVKSLGETEMAEQAVLGKLITLKQGLMQTLLTGRVRVL